MERHTPSEAFGLGSSLPKFTLKNVDGNFIRESYLQGAPAQLVIFTCNHCPYVKGSEEMLLSILKKFRGRGLKTIAINSNDPMQYPEDSFEKMVEKANALDLPYPYLFDSIQEVAKLFDAACTPEFYLFQRDGTLVYHGTINDSPRDASKVTKDFLSDAIEATLSGQQPNPSFVHPIGCSIKWVLK